MSAKMTISGDREVARSFRVIQTKAQDVTPAWKKFGSWLARTLNQQFTSEGVRLTGKKWRPLKPEYRLWKIRNGWSRKILVMSGRMRKTFTSRPMDIEEYKPHSARFGSRDQRAVWQQYGTHRDGKRVIYPRKILVVTPEVRREMRSKVADHLMGRRRP